MPIPTSFADLSTTVASNSPSGSDNVFPDLDNYIRFINAALASIQANSGNGWTSPYIAGSWASPGTIGSSTANTGRFTTLEATTTSLFTGVATFTAKPAGSGTVLLFAAPTGPIGTTTPVGSQFTFAHTAPVVVTFSATAMAVDCSLSNVFTTTFTANVTVAPTFSNLKDGQTINWFITQDGTGSRTMTWPSSFKWPGASAGVLSTAASSADLLVATYRSATGFWYATLSKGFA